MMKVRAQSIQMPVSVSGASEIEQIHYQSQKLEILMREVSSNRIVCVEFEEPLGFRVLDEREMTNYWPTCSTQNGWLFQIYSDGWLTEENKRNSIAELFPKAKEFLVTSIMECVTVIAINPPVVRLYTP